MPGRMGRWARGREGGPLHPAVVLLPAAPPLFHPFHHPGPPGLPRPPGAWPGPRAPRSLDRLEPRGPDPGHMPPPADHRPDQGQYRERRAGGLEVHTVGYHSGREQPRAGDDADECLCQLALIVHARVAGAHETPELRVLSVERLLDLFQLALLVFRERHDASHKNLAPGTCAVVFTSHTRFNSRIRALTGRWVGWTPQQVRNHPQLGGPGPLPGPPAAPRWPRTGS